MKITHVNATPRSKVFSYYTTAGQSTGNYSTYTPPSINIDSNEFVLNPIGTGNVVQSIDNNVIDASILDVVYSNTVTKINAGTNITINPTSGIGEVTISANTSGLNFVPGNQNLPLTKNLTWNSGTSTLTETRGYGYTFNNVNSGNGVVGVMPNAVSNPLVNDIPVSVTLGWFVNSVAESADNSTGFYFRSANAAPTITNSGFNSTLNLPYKQLQAGTGISLSNSGSSVIITNTSSGGSSSFNFVAGNNQLPMTKNLTWNSGTSTLTETRGYGYQFNNVNQGNGVVGVMPNAVSNPLTQDIPVSVTMGWFVNAVAENADTSNGFFFRCANAAPSITNSGFNSTLNLPYKQLQAGTGISLTNSGSSVIITNTSSGGSGGGNVISNLPSGYTTIRMFRYEYFLPSNVTISGYGNVLLSNVAKNTITGISSIFNYFPSLTYKTTSVTPVPVTIQIIDDGGSTFRILVVNCNSSSVTLISGTEVDVLIFGV